VRTCTISRRGLSSEAGVPPARHPFSMVPGSANASPFGLPWERDTTSPRGKWGQPDGSALRPRPAGGAAVARSPRRRACWTGLVAYSIALPMFELRQLFSRRLPHWPVKRVPDKLVECEQR